MGAARRKRLEREAAPRSIEGSEPFAHVRESDALAGSRAIVLQALTGVVDVDNHTVTVATSRHRNAATVWRGFDAMLDRVLDDRDQQVWRERVIAQFGRDFETER